MTAAIGSAPSAEIYERIIRHVIEQIGPLDEAAMAAARARQDRLTKPPGSLGRLEALSIQVAGITGNALPQIEHKTIVVMAGDHGVVAEGVSAYPQAVTAQMVFNFLEGGAAINVMARHAEARVVVVDMGVAATLAAHPNLVNKKVTSGTNNIARGPAMNRGQALQALAAGIDVVQAELATGLDVLGTGEMGIGNTTPAAAIACALTLHAAETVVGRGTGLNDDQLMHKVRVVEQALTTNQPNPKDILDVLAKVGGFEIAGLAGAMLAAAAQRKPIVVDGFISTAAAMVAVALAPQIQPYLFAAHCSHERGHGLMLDWLALKPMLDLGLRLGEGSGAAMGISVLELSCKILREMATFDEAGVSEKESQPQQESH